MTTFLKSSSLLLFCIWGAANVSAADDFNHHVIVLIDRSGSMQRDRPSYPDFNQRREAFGTIVTRYLSEVCFTRDKIIPGRKLLDASKGDYLSVVSFGLERENPDFSEFIQTQIRGGTSYGYKYKRDFTQEAFNDLWDAINEHYFDFLSKYWSAISVAMPMAVYSLRDSLPKVNRTFLLLVTDDEFNGEGDPNLEIDQIDKAVTVRNIESVLPIYEKVRSHYFWKKFPDKPFERSKYGIKLKVFEFTPLANVFAIESTLMYDNQELYFSRIPEGYSANFRVQAHNDSLFSIVKLKAALVDAAGTIIRSDSLADIRGVQIINFQLSNQYFKKDIRLKFETWVHLKDDAYGIHILHPRGSNLQGAQGLTRIVPAVFEETMRVWSIVPLWEGLYKFTSKFWFDGQEAVRVFWEVIFVLMLLAIILILVRMRSVVSTKRMNLDKLKLKGEY